MPQIYLLWNVNSEIFLSYFLKSSAPNFSVSRRLSRVNKSFNDTYSTQSPILWILISSEKMLQIKTPANRSQKIIGRRDKLDSTQTYFHGCGCGPPDFFLAAEPIFRVFISWWQNSNSSQSKSGQISRTSAANINWQKSLAPIGDTFFSRVKSVLRPLFATL